MAAETASAPTALTANSFTRSGYSFSGWNTATDGSGTAYADGADYPFTASATLYAQWHASGGGGGGGGGGGSSSFVVTISPGSQTVSAGGTASWTVSVTNTGGAYLYAVGLSDPGAPGCGSPPSSDSDTLYFLPPNLTVTYSCSVSGSERASPTR